MYTNLLNKKVKIFTLGCKVNQYESEGMLEELLKAGCLKTEEDDVADICIINTCSVTNMADRKSRQIISRAKKKNPNTIIAATGCYVQASKEKIEETGLVDLIVGNNRKKDIVRLLNQYMDNVFVEDNFIDINKTSEYEEISIETTFEHTRAYVKIQDGCNNFCSYCIIPYTRGRIRSRKCDEVINEITKLSQNGVKEVVLTGINLSSYDDGENNLTDVICKVAEIEGIIRIRLGSLEPRIITREFLETISKLKKVCPHFHLSLQSACDETLKRMNRKYTIKEYMEKCSLIREYYDRPALTTDVIVGFPDESEEEFEETYKNLVELNLYEMHVFKYSMRQGTVAAKMKNQIKEEVKDIRSEKLIELRNKNQLEFEKTFKGEDVNVLIEEIVEINGENYFRGHTERYMRVDVKCEDICNAEKNNTLINTVISVKY